VTWDPLGGNVRAVRLGTIAGGAVAPVETMAGATAPASP